MQSNRTQAAEHARDQRGKGQPQQEAKRKRTGTRRILRAIRGRIRGRTSMRRHRKICVLRAVCWVEASQPARTAAKAVAQTGWKPQRNRGRQSRFNFTPALFAPQQRGGNVKTRFRMATRASPTGPAHQLSAFTRWFGVPQTTRTRYAGRVRLHTPAAHSTPRAPAGRRHPIRKDQR